MADLIDTAREAGQFTILMKALETADLIDTLRGPGPFTIFAPNDDAFVMLPQGVFQALLNDVPKLKQILLNHVVEGEYFADDVMEAESLTNVQGQQINIDLSQGVMVDNASIVQTDIECDNGVIHAIDAVIAPKVPSRIQQ